MRECVLLLVKIGYCRKREEVCVRESVFVSVKVCLGGCVGVCVSVSMLEKI